MRQRPRRALRLIFVVYFGASIVCHLNAGGQEPTSPSTARFLPTPSREVNTAPWQDQTPPPPSDEPSPPDEIGPVPLDTVPAPQQPVDPDEQPIEPLETAPPPFQPVDATATFPQPSFTGGSLEGLFGEIAGLPPPPAPATQVTEGQASLFGAPSTGLMITKSDNNTTVALQQRSAVSFDPRVRGYSFGQVYSQSDGQQWSPVRQDLDTVLSKIDPALIQNVVVIPGPYGLRYGPGFSFIDVQTSETPRYANGYEGHERIAVNYRENGEQIFGTTSLFGGGSDWGYIFAYGNRTGNDYRSGNGTNIPASYLNQNFRGQIGFDLTPDVNLEFRYQRLDQTNTEYAGQFFDVRFLKTDAFSLRYVDESPDALYSRFMVEGWYNQTVFAGDTTNLSKTLFNVTNRVERAIERVFDPTPPNANRYVPGPGLNPASAVDFLGFTEGVVVASGMRSVLTYGEDGGIQLTGGADLHYRKQRIEEDYSVTDPLFPPNDFTFDTNLPRANIVDPGLFAELVLPLESYWTSSVGARVDWVNTDARVRELRSNTNLRPDELSQNDVLYAFYLLNDVRLTHHWNTRFGFGHAQRPPTLTERYADGVFLGIIQSGFNRFIGTPTLDKERAWQIDASLEAEFGDARARISGFHSWVFDYVTFTSLNVSSPEGGRLLSTLNTDRATLTGFELYTELNVTLCLTAFGSMSFVEGRDLEIDRALFSIPPLEGRTGLRLHDAQGGKKWAIQMVARIVNDQDRIGGVRVGIAPPYGVSDFEMPTPGFTTVATRGYYIVNDNLSLVGGIDNLFDNNYLEHLSLRLPPDQGDTNDPPGTADDIPATYVFAPGFSPYFGVEWTY